MPSWKPLIAPRLARLSLCPAREQEIVDELSQHLDDRYDDLRRAGKSHEQAIELAISELDDDRTGSNLLGREMRALRQSASPPPVTPGTPARSVLVDARWDIVYALRMLRKTPGFTLVAILTLALGIGANTAIFSLVNAMMLQRVPLRQAEQVDYVFLNDDFQVTSYPGYKWVRDGARMFDGIAAWGGITASLNADGETDLVRGAIVTGNLFEVLGINALRGRLIATTDDITPGGHPVAVISERLWNTRFGARPDVVGSSIRLNGGTFTVIGITPESFPGPRLAVQGDLFVPMMMQALMRPPRAGYSGEMNPDLLNRATNSWLFQIARRKDGVSREQAQAELVPLVAAFSRAQGDREQRPPRMSLAPVETGGRTQRQQMQSVAFLLGGVVAAVLLICCANVANLLLAKATARRREIAIRLALGASRRRIVRQLLTESVLLSTIGAAAGVLLAWTAVRAFEAAPPPASALPVPLAFAIDMRVLLFSLVVALATGLVFGAVPALQASHPGLVPGLKDDVTPEGRSRRLNIKSALVIAEVALSLMLLIAAGLFVRSLGAARTVSPGYAVDRLASAPLQVNLLRYTKAQGREFYSQVVERVEQIPGVERASVARIAVLTGGARVVRIAVEGRPDSGARGQSEGSGSATQPGETALVNVIGTGFFETLGIPLVRGRGFDDRDLEDSPMVAVVTETMARQFFPNEDPIGKRFTTGVRNAAGQWVEIVGLARDTKYASLTEDPAPVIYLPLSQRHETGVTLYVRSMLPPAALVPQVRRTIQAVEPNLPVPTVETMTQTIGTSLYVQRMGAWMLTAFAGLALLLAALGVYGVLAFAIARRTREIGIRMALGANRSQVFRLVIREGMRLVGIGLVTGMAAGLYGAAALRAFLFDVSVRDPRTFIVVPAILATVALLACYLPARRAVRVDPMVALRD